MGGFNNKLAGQIGEHLVCAELGRHGFIATPFSGNVPTFDVLATDEQCHTVPIQIKASRSDNWQTDARLWMNLKYDPKTRIQHYHGTTTITNPELIYVCVVIAAPGGRDRFFILTKADIQKAIVKEHSQWMEKHGWMRPRNSNSFHCIWKISYIEQFEDNWNSITERLQATAPDSSLIISEEQD